MLTKKTNGVANGPRLSKALAGVVGSAIDRRTFLRRSGLAVGGAAALSAMSSGMVKKAEAQTFCHSIRFSSDTRSIQN